MNSNILIVGVGGQGTLLASVLLGNLALKKDYDVKLSEVHGMSQRGGDVQSNLRLSTDEIHSDLIAHGQADLIISMEPMEALRYVTYLSANGCVVTSSKPFVNIPNYPDQAALAAELDRLPHIVKLEIEKMAEELGNPKGSNMVLLGMAAPFLKILSADQLRRAISTIFASKGEAVVESNLKAFDAGFNSVNKQ